MVRVRVRVDDDVVVGWLLVTRTERTRYILVVSGTAWRHHSIVLEDLQNEFRILKTGSETTQASFRSSRTFRLRHAKVMKFHYRCTDHDSTVTTGPAKHPDITPMSNLNSVFTASMKVILTQMAENFQTQGIGVAR